MSAASAGAGALQNWAAVSMTLCHENMAGSAGGTSMGNQNRWRIRSLSSQCQQEAISIVPDTQQLLLPLLISFTGSSQFDGSFADCGPSLVPVILAEPWQMFKLLMGRAGPSSRGSHKTSVQTGTRQCHCG